MGEPLIREENEGEDSMLIQDGSNSIQLACFLRLQFKLSQTFCGKKASVEL